VPVDSAGYFDLTPHGVSQDFRRDAITMLERMGISVEFSHHEVAPGQQEIDLRYADALSTADNILTTRHVIKEVALSQGVYATFMPKPFSLQPGSGMHTHLSLFEGDQNAFYDGSDPCTCRRSPSTSSPGCSQHAAEITAVTNQYGQLLQAAVVRRRGAAVRVLGLQQPQRAGAGADVQAEEERLDPHRGPQPGQRRPTPTCASPLLLAAGPQGHRGGLRDAARRRGRRLDAQRRASAGRWA
jgi:glutamine synthetase